MVRQLTDAARAGGWIYHHVQRTDYGRQMGLRGFPDLILIRRDALLALEVKAGRGVVTPEQWQWIEAFLAAGAEAYVVTPDTLHEWLDLLRRDP